MIQRKQIIGVIFSISALALATGAQAQKAKFRTGTLVCKGKGGIGLIIGSREKLLCTYTPSGNRPKHEFHGVISKLGLDIGIKGKSTMVWGVFGSSTQLPGEALVGSFGGVSADATLGIGAGANFLVGGNAKSVVLQPLSIKAAVGVNLAVGVSSLRLDPRP